MASRKKISSTVLDLIRNNPELKRDLNEVKCLVCFKNLICDGSHGADRVRSHLASRKHVENLRSNGDKNQILIKEAVNKSDFTTDLVKWFIEADIPINKINMESTKSFFRKHLKQEPPSESTMRKNFSGPIFESSINQIRQIIGNNMIYLIVDETTDFKQRYVFNVLVGTLNGEVSRSMLIAVRYLEETNSETVTQAILDVLTIIWPDKLYYERIWLLISDQAPYMIKAGRTLKNFLPNLKHISCLVHALHRVSEKIRDENEKIDELISQTKKVLLKSPKRQQLFKSMTGLTLPKKVVITRWGTWLAAAYYYAENFDKIFEYIDKLSDKSASIQRAKTIFKDPKIKEDLVKIMDYKFLTESIVKLQEQGLSVKKQILILETVLSKLDEPFKEKLLKCIEKNPDFKIFKSDTTCEFKLKTKYAPLVSVDVERSFSKYKAILRDDRMSFTQDNIEKYLIVNYNSFLNYN